MSVSAEPITTTLPRYGARKTCRRDTRLFQTARRRGTDRAGAVKCRRFRGSQAQPDL
jgi:hypothetical protein